MDRYNDVREQTKTVQMCGLIRWIFTLAIGVLLSACSANIPLIGTVKRMPADVLDGAQQRKVIDELNAARDAQRAGSGEGVNPKGAQPALKKDGLSGKKVKPAQAV